MEAIGNRNVFASECRYGLGIAPRRHRGKQRICAWRNAEVFYPKIARRVKVQVPLCAGPIHKRFGVVYRNSAKRGRKDFF